VKSYKAIKSESAQTRENTSNSNKVVSSVIPAVPEGILFESKYD